MGGGRPQNRGRYSQKRKKKQVTEPRWDYATGRGWVVWTLSQIRAGNRIPPHVRKEKFSIFLHHTTLGDVFTGWAMFGDGFAAVDMTTSIIHFTWPKPSQNTHSGSTLSLSPLAKQRPHWHHSWPFTTHFIVIGNRCPFSRVWWNRLR